MHSIVLVKISVSKNSSFSIKSNLRNNIQIIRQRHLLFVHHKPQRANPKLRNPKVVDPKTIAREHFRILKKINPANPFGYYYSGLTEEYVGNPVQAQIEFENAIRLKPDYQKAAEALAKY